MVFSSIIFLFMFLPIFLACYFIFKKNKTRNIILLLFSLLFYAWGEPYYIFLMIFSILVNYFLTIKMEKKNSKLLFILLIAFNLLLLLSFKYVDFFISNINNLFNTNISLLKLSLPIGISFYTFQILSYVIDVYNKKIPVQKNLYTLACYISSFPQLIAGPIVRYSDVEKELNERKVSFDDFSMGVRRFIIGLAKKALIANNVAFVCDAILSSSFTEIGFIGIIIAIISYTLQIYYDFSGYSDMAIGLGRMLGFHYMENFNYPYMAKNITDFWRRWHISLSSFFRDYVYIPLGGNRCSKVRNIINIMIVWFLTGMWHGAGWNFILWGLYYGILLIIEKNLIKKITDKSWYRIITIIIICIGWLIFRQTDFNDLLLSFKALFGGFGLGSITSLYYLGIFSFRYILAFILGIIFCFDMFSLNKKQTILTDIVLLVLFILSIVVIVVGSYNPFIYFRF